MVVLLSKITITNGKVMLRPLVDPWLLTVSSVEVLFGLCPAGGAVRSQCGCLLWDALDETWNIKSVQKEKENVSLLYSKETCRVQPWNSFTENMKFLLHVRLNYVWFIVQFRLIKRLNTVEIPWWLAIQQRSELSDWMEAGLICIFIEPHILNEARVSSYNQDIFSHEEFFSRK